MSIIRNLNLRPKLIGSFIFVTILGIIITLISNQFARQKLAEDSIPTLQVTSRFSQLINEVRAEALEFVASSEEESLEDLNETIAELIVIIQEVENLADDPGEAAIFTELTNAIQLFIPLIQSIAQSHSQTISELEALEEGEAGVDTIFLAVTEIINAEIARNVQNDDFNELIEDAIPSTQLLNQVILGTKGLQTEALKFVAGGEAETIEEFKAISRELEIIQARLETFLEPDEPGEALVIEQINEAEETIQVAGQATIDSHAHTLALLDDLEDAENQIEAILTAVEQRVDEDVNEGFVALTTNILIGSVVVFVVSVTSALFLANSIIQPVSLLEKTVEQMSTGDLTVRAEVKSNDEIGRLGNAFNSMVAQLQNTLVGLDQLEQQVANRTQALATSAEVSRHLSTILDEQKLVTTVVEQLQSAFNYYHAHIYLLNESGDTLLMVGGTGAAGAEMLANGHNILMGRGLVGRAAQTNTSVLVPDISQVDDWVANPLLPETKSETAVPISFGDQVLGVLDVQHNVADGLHQSDVKLLESIASQVAIGLQNARNFIDAQQRAEQETLLNHINHKIDAADTVEEVMQVTVRELGRALGADQTAIRFLENGRHETITQS